MDRFRHREEGKKTNKPKVSERKFEAWETEMEGVVRKERGGEANLSGLMTLRRADESTPVECY